MESRLVPINGLIALLTGDGGWPRPLGDAGYNLHGLEARIFYASKKRVVVDALLSHESARMVVLSECKSGQNLRQSQMEGYSKVTGQAVATHFGLPFRANGLELLIVALDEHEGRMKIALDDLHMTVPMLLISRRRARLTAPLSSVSPFDINVPGLPPPVIVLDDQSTDTEFIRHLIPALIARVKKRQKMVGVDDLLADVIPWWRIYHVDGGHESMCDRATKALRLTLAEFFAKDFIVETRSGQHCGVVRVLQSPGDNRPRGVTQGWQRLQRQAERAVGQRQPKPVPPGQMSFEDLGLKAGPSGTLE